MGIVMVVLTSSKSTNTNKLLLIQALRIKFNKPEIHTTESLKRTHTVQLGILALLYIIPTSYFLSFSLSTQGLMIILSVCQVSCC